MKRRDFLKTTTALAVPMVGAGDRLYGTPASLTEGKIQEADKFTLPLASAGFPTEHIPDASRICTLWSDILLDEVHAKRFFESPRLYLQTLGISSHETVMAEEGAQLLCTLASGTFRSALKGSDYHAAYAELSRSAGSFSSSKLAERLTEILTNHGAFIRENLGLNEETIESALGRLGEHLNRNHATPSEIDLAMVAEVMRISAGKDGALPQCASCIVAVAIAATVALYVSVVVGATVAVLAGVWVSVGVSIAVKANTTMPTPHLFPGFSGKYLRLDHESFRVVTRQLQWAKATGDAGFQLHVIKESVRKEIEATLVALNAVNIVPIGADYRKPVVDALTIYTTRAMGLPKDDVE